MSTESLTKWVPLLGLPEKLYLSSLTDNEQGLCLNLVGDTDIPVLSIRFEAALSYRNADEGDRLKFLNEISGQSDWSLYMVSNSNYLAWFNEQSYSTYDEDSIKHYLFFTPNDIVDVLSTEEPSVVYE